MELFKLRKIERKIRYFLTVKLKENTNQNLHQKIISFCYKPLTNEDFVDYEEATKLQNFDEFIPNNLLYKAFACDYIDRWNFIKSSGLGHGTLESMLSCTTGDNANVLAKGIG